MANKFRSKNLSLGTLNIPAGFGGQGAAQPTATGGGCATALGHAGSGEPWSIIAVSSIAAGALAADTDLVQVFDASESTQISADNKVPEDFVSTHIKVYIGVLAVDDAGTENMGELAGLYFREAEGSGGGQEKAIWHLSDLGATIGYFGGFGTSTGGAPYIYQLSAAGVPWNRTYKATGTYSLSLRHTDGFTSVNAMRVCTVISGRRNVG